MSLYSVPFFIKRKFPYAYTFCAYTLNTVLSSVCMLSLLRFASYGHNICSFCLFRDKEENVLKYTVYIGFPRTNFILHTEY